MTVTDTIPLIDISVQHLLTAAMITAVETIGVVQYLKKVFKHCGKIANPICCICFGFINTRFVPPEWTAVLDIIFLGFAAVQICHDTIMKALPRTVEKLLLGNMEGKDGQTG